MDNRDNLGFLLYKVGSLVERASDKLLFNEFGIGFSQFRILFAIEQQSLPQQKQLAEFLGQTEASISRQVKILLKDGLVIISPDKSDKKKHLLSLTARGKRLATEAFLLLNNFFGPILENVSERDQTIILSRLAQIHDALELRV